jgi:shikimate dehydrogenase
MSTDLQQRRVAVIGYPVAHSRSPLIHNYWLNLYGIPGSYDRIAVAPAELAAFIGNFADQGLVGCNVTVPHKEQVARLVRIPDPETARLGSVNTVWMEDGKLLATSTDGYGFLQSLRSAAPDFTPQRMTAMVLGAGGAARPIIAALRSAGMEHIRLANRTAERAATLAAELGDDGIHPVDWSEIPAKLASTDLLVNATSLGMTGGEPLAIDLAPLPSVAIVADIVYVPLQTDLLRQARARGLRSVDGLGMLLHQAVPGFERWFGRRPEVTPELRALIVRDLTG